MVMAIFFVMAIIICGYALILLLNILFGGLKILFVFLMLGYILMSSIGIAGLIKYKKLHKVAKVSTILLMIPVFFSTILMMFFRKSIWQYMLSIYFSVSNILTIRNQLIVYIFSIVLLFICLGIFSLLSKVIIKIKSIKEILNSIISMLKTSLAVMAVFNTILLGFGIFANTWLNKDRVAYMREIDGVTPFMKYDELYIGTPIIVNEGVPVDYTYLGYSAKYDGIILIRNSEIKTSLDKMTRMGAWERRFTYLEEIIYRYKSFPIQITSDNCIKMQDGRKYINELIPGIEDKTSLEYNIDMENEVPVKLTYLDEEDYNSDTEYGKYLRNNYKYEELFSTPRILYSYPILILQPDVTFEQMKDSGKYNFEDNTFVGMDLTGEELEEFMEDVSKIYNIDIINEKYKPYYYVPEKEELGIFAK